MVSWEDFYQAIATHLDCSLSQAEADHLATVLGKNTLNSPLSLLLQSSVALQLLHPCALVPLGRISNRPQLVTIVRSRSGSIRNGERHQVS
jgi:hypothetical protein